MKTESKLCWPEMAKRKSDSTSGDHTLCPSPLTRSSTPPSLLLQVLRVGFFPPLGLVLAVVLGGHQSPDDSHQHGASDDEHGGGLGHAELAVHTGQRGAGQLPRLTARHIAVVVQVQVAHAEDLAEDAVQVAVTAPGVAGQLQVRA